MKKITYLLMLILMTNTFSSQITNTKNTKCLTETQLNEIYKGLKQGEYLKKRLSKTEETLEIANNIIKYQEKILSTKDTIIQKKDEMITNNIFIHQKEIDLKEIQVIELNNTIQQNIILSKKVSRKKLWKGLGLGILGGAIITTSTFLLLK